MTTPATSRRSPRSTGATSRAGWLPAVRIGVRSVEAPPEILDADVVVDGPGGLARLIDALGEAVDARQLISARAR